MKFFFTFYVSVFLLLLNISTGQTVGVGYSSYFKKDIDRGRAEAEALLDAEKNALIVYGGYINFSSTSQTSQSNTSGGKNSSVKFDSKYHSSIKQLMEGMVKSLEKPRYELRAEGKKKYIVARGTFSIDLVNIGDMITLYAKHTGNKIHVDIKSNSCETIPKYFREYLTNNSTVFIFPPEGKYFVEGDFVIEIFKDHIDLHDKRTGYDVQDNKHSTGVVFKTFTYDNCNNALKDKDSEDGLFFRTKTELFKLYLSKISDEL